MDDRWLTAEELSKKYEVDDGTVSLAMSLGKVFNKAKTGQKPGVRLYPECDAVKAMLRLFKVREQRYEGMAMDWRAKAERAEKIYEGRT